MNERLSSSMSTLDRARRLIISSDARGQGPALRVSGDRGAVEWSGVEDQPLPLIKAHDSGLVMVRTRVSRGVGSSDTSQRAAGSIVCLGLTEAGKELAAEVRAVFWALRECGR